MWFSPPDSAVSFSHSPCRFASFPVCKMAFSFAVFCPFLCVQRGKDPHFSALDTQKLLIGTRVLLSHTSDSGIKTVEWEGHYVAFSPDGVRFSSSLWSVFTPHSRRKARFYWLQNALLSLISGRYTARKAYISMQKSCCKLRSGMAEHDKKRFVKMQKEASEA